MSEWCHLPYGPFCFNLADLWTRMESDNAEQSHRSQRSSFVKNTFRRFFQRICCMRMPSFPNHWSRMDLSLNDWICRTWTWFKLEIAASLHQWYSSVYTIFFRLFPTRSHEKSVSYITCHWYNVIVFVIILNLIFSVLILISVFSVRFKVHLHQEQ